MQIDYKMRYKCSENLIVLDSDEPGNYVVYNSLFGNVCLLNEPQKNFLMSFRENGNPMDVLSKLYGIAPGHSEFSDYLDFTKTLVDSFFLVEENFSERNFLHNRNLSFVKTKSSSFPFRFIGFSITSKCNFSCKYCIAKHQLESGKKTKFDNTNLSNFLRLFLSQAQKNHIPEIGIGFTGGEPILEWKLISSVLEKIYTEYGSKIHLRTFINTNASLITKEMCQQFRHFEASLSLSLDGPKEYNDKVRVFANQRGTFDTIISKFKLIKDCGIPVESFYLTLSDRNFDFNIESLMDLADHLGVKNITIEPDLIMPMKTPVNLIVNKLISTYFFGKKRGIEISGFWRRPFENGTDFSTSRSGFCRALDFESLVVDGDGNVSPCGYSTTNIGNFLDYVQSENKNGFCDFVIRNLRGEIEKCKGCEIEGLCKGGCYITRESNIPSLFEYRCGIYRGATRELMKRSDAYE